MADDAAGPDAAPPLARTEEILEALGEGFCVFDRDWRLTYANRAAEDQFGLKREAVLGRTYWEMVPHAVGTPVEALLRRAMGDRVPAELELPSVLKPGTIVSLRAFPMEEGLGLAFRDVSDRHRQARREREQAERLELALEASGLGDWSWDVATDLVTLSDRAAAIFDVTAGPVMTWTAMLELINPHDRERTAWAVAGALADRSLYEAEFRVRRPSDGVEVWVMSRAHGQYGDDGVPLGMLGVVADITAQKVADAAIRESEERFRAMADSAPAPVWVTSAAGPIEFVNQAFGEYVGRPREELLGDVWLDLLHPDDIATIVAARAAARGQTAAYAYEARFKRHDGAWRLMLVHSQPRFHDTTGRFQGYVGIATDITDARAAESRQRLLINELNHRVKNTLATVQSLARQTLKDGLAPRDARKLLEARLMALSAAHNVLTRETWAGAELTEIAAEAVRPFEDPQAPRIALAGPPVRTSPNVALALSLALHELATNATKYGALSRPGGQVAVSWKNGGETITLTWRETGGPALSGPPAAKGFGSRLLGPGLSGELGAPATLQWEPTGLVCTLVAPISV
jgi:PAS domain S-box-containing protein